MKNNSKTGTSAVDLFESFASLAEAFGPIGKIPGMDGFGMNDPFGIFGGGSLNDPFGNFGGGFSIGGMGDIWTGVDFIPIPNHFDQANFGTQGVQAGHSSSTETEGSMTRTIEEWSIGPSGDESFPSMRTETITLTNRETGDTKTSSTHSVTDPETGITTTFGAETHTDIKGNMTKGGAWVSQTDEDGNVIGHHHTTTNPNGNTHTSSGGTMADDGSGDGGFWDADIIYGDHDEVHPDAPDFSTLGKQGVAMLENDMVADALGKDGAEGFVDQFDYFM